VSQQTTQPPTRPWTVDVIPDLMGYLLLINGTKTYITKQDLDPLLVALAMVKERESDHDWLADLAAAIRGERGEHSESPAERG
jgi:hypothetical protein